MSELPDQIFQRWFHSFEEDTATEEVYRPMGYPFPRARGRAAIELRPDGQFLEYRVGRGDAGEVVSGRWEAEEPDQVRVAIERGGRTSPVTLEITSVGQDVLRLRKQAT